MCLVRQREHATPVRAALETYGLLHEQIGRTRITYFQPGTPYSMGVAPKADDPTLPVLQGPSIARYTVDCYLILHEPGLVAADFVTCEDVTRAPRTDRAS